MKGKILIRADGGLITGLGHLIRCIALAQMLKEDFDISFYSLEIPEVIRREILLLQFTFQALDDENAFFSFLSPGAIVVLDKYTLDPAYQLRVKSAGNKLVFIDDLHDRVFFADLIINISPGVTSLDYEAQPYTKFALGLQYALLRPEFLLNSGKLRKIPVDSNALICLGGSDNPNNTMQVLESVCFLSDRSIYIIVGDSYPHSKVLSEFIASNKLASRVTVYRNLGPENLIKVMQSCSIAVCSPSTISIEYLAVARGVLLLLQTADNQKSWNEFALSKYLGFKFHPDSYQKSHELIPDYALLDTFFDGLQRQRLLQLFKNL